MKKKLGFTLVEIMIVVAIIALLTAIAIPAFLTYRRDARRSLCINNQRNIEHAKEAYAISRNLPEDQDITWGEIGDYVGQVDYLYCPEFGTNGTYSTSAGTHAAAAGTIVGDVTGTNRVVCPWAEGVAQRHVYTPGEN